MRWLFVIVMVWHGGIHLMGFTKAFGLAEIPEFTRAIPRGTGLLWLSATLLTWLAVVLYLAAPRAWWAVGLAAALVSQLAIVTSWPDAKWGTLANLILLAVAAYGFASRGPLSFRATYDREVAARAVAADAASGVDAPDLVTDGDLGNLPGPVRRYLERFGAVGQPRPTHFEADFRGRIRAAADEPWMDFRVRQHDFTDPPARFFHMEARRSGVPIDVYHAFADGAASMRVRVLSAFPVASSSGPEVTLSETVTFFNDLCLLAPAALLDAKVVWEPIGDDSARARFTLGAATISAELWFGVDGMLVDFVSHDRSQASSDGTSFTRRAWSTPVFEHGDYGPYRSMRRAQGRWHEGDGDFAYIEMELVALRIYPIR